MLSGTFQNTVGLVIKDKNHPTDTSEALDNSLLVTGAHYYACSM